MNWNNNDTKYILKRFIIYILIAFAMFIIGTWRADAKSVSPTILQYYKPNATDTWNRKPVHYSRFGQDYYTTSISTANDIAGIYGISNNQISGSYVSFTMLKGQPVPSVTAYIQLLDSSFMSCEIVTDNQDYADGTYYTAKCNVGNSQQIYKYGFQWSDSQGYVASENSILISKINAFDNEGEYNTYLNNLNSSIQSASNQAHQDAQQAHQDAQQAHQDAQQINDSINNDNITSSDADDFTNNQAFSDSTGLESVIQLPLNMINSLTSTCQPIQITIPFINYTGEIPCMSTIYRSKFNTLYTIVKLVINGFFVYRLLLKVYELVHNAKQPDEDKLEVIDL